MKSKEQHDIFFDGYTDLANAIIEMAAEDYKRALKVLHTDPHDSKWRGMKTSVERFFKSEWYQVLTDVDPNYLINELKRSVL